MSTTTDPEIDTTIRSGSIVVAVDGSHSADQAISWAAEEARLTQRPLTIVHVERALGAQEHGWLAQAGVSLHQVTEELRQGSEELLSRALTQATAVAPAVETDAILRNGDPREGLLELASRASMIVLGSRGRGPVPSLLLGSVSVAVSRHASCPVVVVRPRDDNVRLRGVLVGADDAGHSSTTLESAFHEASIHGLPLTVVHCRWESISGPGGWRAAQPGEPFYDSARRKVAEALTGLREKFPDVAVEVELFAGHVDQCLADLSREHDLTVVGRRAHSRLSRVGSFSLTMAIVEHASGPVLVVP